MIVSATKAIVCSGILGLLVLCCHGVSVIAPCVFLVGPEVALALMLAHPLQSQREIPGMKNIFIRVIRLYQFLSTFTPPCCRFTPSCSHYTVQAIEHHGVFHGSWLGLKRLCRCHPLSQGGFDPPPPARVTVVSPGV
jgi:uncharacterized protein